MKNSPETIAPTLVRMQKEFGLTKDEIWRLIQIAPDLKSALTEQATAAGLSATKTNLLKIATTDVSAATGNAANAPQTAADAYQAEADRVSGVTQALTQMIDTMNAENDANQKAISANATWQQGLADLTDQVKKNGTSLDEATAKGSANSAMLAGLAGDAEAAAKAQYEVDQKTMSAKDAADKYAATLADQRQKFIDSATAAGFNKDEVGKLADKIFQIPDAKTVKLLVEKDQAERDLADFTKSRTMKIFASFETSKVGPLKGAYGFGSANGNMIRAYENGGTESHIAQMAHAGAWRLWAEPETGGESYIPHTQSKRARSERIMAQTAAILSGEYIPRGHAFANGGMIHAYTPPQYASSQPTGIDYERLAAALSAGSTGPTLRVGPVYGTDGDDLARQIVKQQGRALAVTGALRRDGD